MCIFAVAPLVGAWIEITNSLISDNFQPRRSSCRSVDWNIYYYPHYKFPTSRSSCRSVDWNIYTTPFYMQRQKCRSSCRSVDWNNKNIVTLYGNKRRSSCRSVDWNHGLHFQILNCQSRSSCRSVDWNKVNSQSYKPPLTVAPLVGAWIEIFLTCQVGNFLGCSLT